MKKFKVSITIAEFVLYQAIVTLTPEQYQKMLEGYRKSEGRWECMQTLIVCDMTGEDFDDNRDYATEMPDVAVAIMICKNIDYPSGWSDFVLINSNYGATVTKEVDEMGQLTWTCEVIE